MFGRRQVERGRYGVGKVCVGLVHGRERCRGWRSAVIANGIGMGDEVWRACA